MPAAGDPYQTAQQIREIVERETQADAAEASGTGSASPIDTEPASSPPGLPSIFAPESMAWKWWSVT